MIIDSAVKEFMEKYNREAIESIDKISENYGLNINNYKIKLFNLKESFDKFQQYIKGYASYKVENLNNEKASPQNAITERTHIFINDGIIEPKEFKYSELPSFVESYVNGINTLLETIDEVKELMTDGNVDQSAIGDINEYVDLFMTKINESFEPAMDKILWASGYNSRQALLNKKRNKNIEKKPVFL